ncbi:MAG: ABC transporter permease [Alphaproteobacteria bacterium]|nr:ABC transporter permease [Alphaproteobacteria bacterium]
MSIHLLSSAIRYAFSSPQAVTIHVMGVITIRAFSKWAPMLQGELSKKTTQHISVIFEGTASMDMASLYVLASFLNIFSKARNKDAIAFDNTSYSNTIKKYLAQIENSHMEVNKTQADSFGARIFLNAVGQSVANTIQNTAHIAKDLLQFFGHIVSKLYAILVQQKKLSLTSFAYHLDQIGFKAVPIIALISFLIGMVLTYQGINQLARFGAEIYSIDFLTIGVFRELGVMLTAVVVAGRSASSFTAQIGTMNLNQEIDAMRVMGLDPILYLVIPRITALLVALPLLVFLSNIMALLGGMITTQLVIDLTPIQFMGYLQRAFTPATFWVGMSKAPLFALLIGLVGCFRGMQVRDSAESVGRMTTASVVEAIFLVIICNALMSLLFSYLQV